MELPERILDYLNKNSSVDSLKLSSEWKEDHQKIVGAIKSLECLGEVINTEIISNKRCELTSEGKEVIKVGGSHEAITFNAVPKEGISQPELMKKVGNWAKVGFSKSMSLGWLCIDKTDKSKPIVQRKIDSINDLVYQQLKQINEGKDVSDKDRNEYKKRKLITEVVIKSYILSKGSKFTTKIEKAQTELTPEMISSGSWKTTNFKSYNFDAMGIKPFAGNLHPLLKVRTEYRQIFLEMGFNEMPTNNFVESSFWNFDALFQPQQHPARDAHDTFFVSNPAEATEFPQDYLERVKNVHSKGGYGSQGYGYDWKLDEAKKNLLRTHTTAISARMLYKLAQQNNEGEFKPKKYFSIDRVFRNETLDATHLAEFHQIEGVIAEKGLTLGNLIGVLYTFFKKLGIEKLRFKPAYNPYTEPSMEIFSYHEGLKKWVEIGNSGLFRPEMLLPMGIPEGVNVAGYGLSLERPTMIKYKIDNIRELCGNKVNLKMVQDNPICRLDKTSKTQFSKVVDDRWTKINSKITTIATKLYELCSNDEMKEKLLKVCKRETDMDSSKVNELINEKREKLFKLMKGEISPKSLNENAKLISKSKKSNLSDFVIFASPNQPPFAIQAIIKMLSKKNSSVFAQTHVHSSVAKISPTLLDFIDFIEVNRPRLAYDYRITFIWKKTSLDETQLSLGHGNLLISGESNIVRFLNRLTLKLPYDNLSDKEFAEVDHNIDLINNFSSNLSHFEAYLNKNTWLSGKDFSIGDLLLWSKLKQSSKEVKSLKPPLKNWFKKCENQF